MQRGRQRELSRVSEAVSDLERIAQKLMGLSQDEVTRGIAHTEGVDSLIGFVDRIEHASSQPVEGEAGGKFESTPTVLKDGGPATPDPAGSEELPGLCQEVRRKAAHLDRLNRDRVLRASEVSAQAGEIMQVESKLRDWLSSLCGEQQ